MVLSVLYPFIISLSFSFIYVMKKLFKGFIYKIYKMNYQINGILFLIRGIRKW